MIMLKMLSSLFSMGAVTLIVAIVDRGEKVTIILAAIYSVFLFFQSFQTFEYWFQSKLQSRIPTIVQLFAYIVMSCYKVILLIYKKEIYWFAFSISVDMIISGISMYYLYRRQKGPKLKFSSKLYKELLSRSHPFIWAGLIAVIYAKTDTIMLKHIISEAEVGFYTSASLLTSYGTIVLSAITESARPAMISVRKVSLELYTRRLRQKFAIVFWTGSFIAFFFMIFANPMVKMIYGIGYLNSVTPLRIISWNSVLTQLAVARNIWIVCENKQKYLIYISLFGTIINFILNYLLIPLYKASGAAFATIVTQIMTGIVIAYIIKETRPSIKYLIEAISMQKVLSTNEKQAVFKNLKKIFRK
jgi:O-antigen/teichoic acid export membrane protein